MAAEESAAKSHTLFWAGSTKLWLSVPLLFVASHLVFEGTATSLSQRMAAGDAHVYPQGPSLRHCFVLTTNPLLRSLKIAPGLTCEPFLAELFNARQFDLVSEKGKAKLQNEWLQSQASEFSNNQSVSIFVNHARLWKIMDEMPEDEPVLILEEARTLLRFQYPLETHVDVYLHQMGCVRNQVSYNNFPCKSAVLYDIVLMHVIAVQFFPKFAPSCSGRWLPLVT